MRLGGRSSVIWLISRNQSGEAPRPCVGGLRVRAIEMPNDSEHWPTGPMWRDVNVKADLDRGVAALQCELGRRSGNRRLCRLLIGRWGLKRR